MLPLTNPESMSDTGLKRPDDSLSTSLLNFNQTSNIGTHIVRRIACEFQRKIFERGWWSIERNTKQSCLLGQLPRFRIARHLWSNNRHRTSASLTASTGSRPNHERSACFSQRDAAGSCKTSWISGKSPASRSLASESVIGANQLGSPVLS